MTDRPIIADSPRRIQRKRTKGWRMLKDAIYVGRPSRLGNRFHVGLVANLTAADCVRRFRCEQVPELEIGRPSIADLRGMDLACWCALDAPYHADVLLEIANVREGEIPDVVRSDDT